MGLPLSVARVMCGLLLHYILLSFGWSLYIGASWHPIGFPDHYTVLTRTTEYSKRRVCVNYTNASDVGHAFIMKVIKYCARKSAGCIVLLAGNWWMACSDDDEDECRQIMRASKLTGLFTVEQEKRKCWRVLWWAGERKGCNEMFLLSSVCVCYIWENANLVFSSMIVGHEADTWVGRCLASNGPPLEADTYTLLFKHTFCIELHTSLPSVLGTPGCVLARRRVYVLGIWA